MQKLKAGTLIFCAFFLLLITHRSEAQTDTLKLTFQQAEKQFIENNLGLLAQKYNIEAQKALIQQAKLWDNPTLNTDQNIWDGTSHKLFYHGNGYGQYFLQLSQVFQTAGKRGKQIAMAKDNEKVQEAEFNDLMRNLHYNLQLDFSQLAMLVEQGKVYQNEISSAKNLVNAIQKSFDAGNTSMKDLIRLKALLFGAENDMVENSRQINDLETEMKTLLLVKETSFILPRIDNTKPGPDIALDLPSLIEQAKTNRPDYLSNQYQVSSSEHNLAYQKALAVPDVSVGMSFDKNSNYAPNYYGLEIGFPIPFLNRNQGNIKNAKYQLLSQQATLHESEAKLKNDVVAAVNQYQLNKQLFTAQQVQFNEQYDKLFNGMFTAYKQKQISLVEFIDFFDSYKDTKLKILQQQYNMQKAIADLNLSVGATIVKQ
jgi:cobalt-zinc-cadmium efflux system outer membrane protein